MTQVPSKHEVLSSNQKKKKKIEIVLEMQFSGRALNPQNYNK
jgi:hypothetical protein